jgi:hypothetical protein
MIKCSWYAWDAEGGRLGGPFIAHRALIVVAPSMQDLLKSCCSQGTRPGPIAHSLGSDWFSS